MEVNYERNAHNFPLEQAATDFTFVVVVASVIS
jgi:hypothetical protein